MNDLVDVTPSRRRVQALVVRGWSITMLEDLAGTRHSQLWLVANKSAAISQRNASRIAETYELLWDQQPPQQTRQERGSVTRNRALAKARGWLPPLAWDDIDTDPEPPAVPREPVVDELLVEDVCNGLPGTLNRIERHEAIRILNARGYSDTEIAARVGVLGRQVLRIRGALGIPAAVTAGGIPIAS